ncbi:type II secretion system F family protein [Rugamonas apoptosis]|uniref:Type II secretion system F family protein n=1 Tax=Rugamonas apoptosis TaxID=2758570 RepID=A0A7W2F6Y1_9BURK|nr:type II secretion system F family protein [Rugamonas apoptosis]MBA5686226.1 type II secretion system F family protein [Rugamonas apoptosis]
MTIPQIGLLLLLFIIVFGGAMLLLSRFASDPVQQRLEQLDSVEQAGGARRTGKAQSPWLTGFLKLTGPLAKLSVPEGEWEKSTLRTRFMTAGLRNPNAPTLFFGAKTGLAIGLPFITYIVLNTTRSHYSANVLLMWLLLAAAFGYYLPNILLAQRIQNRQRDIFDAFPDALDLMTVCVEAGLGMDAALGRVSNEIGLKSPLLADELNLVTLELRAGNTKERALRNLALRTGVEDVDALVAMLVQAERFGTSVADSLRIQSEQLRTKRRQRAEEMAAKIALKLLFPLIFFIFPSLLVVLMGPAFIQIYRVLLPGIGSGG